MSREALSDSVLREVLVVLPPPENFAAYVDAVRERLIVALGPQVGWRAIVDLYRSQHDDECNCEACDALEDATDEVEPAFP